MNIGLGIGFLLGVVYQMFIAPRLFDKNGDWKKVSQSNNKAKVKLK